MPPFVDGAPAQFGSARPIAATGGAYTDLEIGGNYYYGDSGAGPGGTWADSGGNNYEPNYGSTSAPGGGGTNDGVVHTASGFLWTRTSIGIVTPQLNAITISNITVDGRTWNAWASASGSLQAIITIFEVQNDGTWVQNLGSSALVTALNGNYVVPTAGSPGGPYSITAGNRVVLGFALSAGFATRSMTNGYSRVYDDGTTYARIQATAV